MNTQSADNRSHHESTIEQLRRENRELREDVERGNRFVALVSHELRNLFAAVLNAADVINQADIDPSTDAEARRTIDTQVRHVGRLIDDLFEISRMSRGQVILRREVCDLTVLARKAVEQLQYLVGEKHTRMHCEICETPIRACVDAERMQQVLINLLVNAVKFTGENGQIHFTVSKGDENAIICVRDNGQGIAQSAIDNIFEPFVKSDAPTSRANDGMGLGLYLCRLIVEAHGGSIVARSDGQGKGSTFSVYLPLSAESETKQFDGESARVGEALTRSAERLPAKGMRFLIVEDNVSVRRMLAKSFQMKGYEICASADARDGIQAFHDFEPQVAVIDIGLPDVDGNELARWIRGTEAGEQTTLVAVSGFASESDQIATMEAGFDLHLKKPIEPNLLLRAIAEFRLGKGQD